MEKIIVAISSIGFLAFILGLIKPKIVFMPNRKVSSLVYLVVFIGAAILGSILYPTHSSTSVPKKEDAQPNLAEKKSLK
ncbi:hypothetical protein AB7188_20295 [Providencia rettgeri]